MDYANIYLNNIYLYILSLTKNKNTTFKNLYSLIIMEYLSLYYYLLINLFNYFKIINLLKFKKKFINLNFYFYNSNIYIYTYKYIYFLKINF